MTPTARTLKRLKDDGWIAQVVERFCPYSRKRIDLFGVIDIVAIHPDRRGVFGIQATSASNQSSRMKKCLASPEARIWVEAGNSLQVWGWSKKKVKRGGVAVRWSVNQNSVVFGRKDNETLMAREVDDLVYHDGIGWVYR